MVPCRIEPVTIGHRMVYSTSFGHVEVREIADEWYIADTHVGNAWASGYKSARGKTSGAALDALLTILQQEADNRLMRNRLHEKR